MLPEDVKSELQLKELLDFGIAVTNNGFQFHDNFCELPTSLVITYALAIATSVQAIQIILAGFDGYAADDPRRKEMDQLFTSYKKTEHAIQFVSITPTRYEIPVQSIYVLSL